jgi:tetratricopeptide (TPR) repeat protein
MTTTKAALAILLMAGGATPALAQYGGGSSAPAPQMEAPAQRQQTQQPAQPAQPGAPQRNYNLSRGERTAFQPVIVAVNAQDWPTATTALAAAAAQARGNDAKYLVGQIRLQIGIGTQNRAFQSQAIDEMLASGGAQPTELRALYENQLDFATAAGDTAKAQRAMAELQRLNPNDPNLILRQARVRAAANDAPGAIALYQQAIRMNQAANQPIPVEWRQQIAGLAYRSRSPDTLRYMREWLTAAPSPALWHDILAIYAEQNATLKLDTYRLMRAAGVMNSERDFIELYTAANAVRAFGEVQAVIQDGLRRNLIVQNAGVARESLALATRRATDDRGSLAEGRRAALAGSNAQAVLAMGDAYYGYGEYGPAAELYRAALDKGMDAGVANIRLGAALAMAGQRPAAEAAFRAVSGPRAELAQLWLLWLSSRTS